MHNNLFWASCLYWWKEWPCSNNFKGNVSWMVWCACCLISCAPSLLITNLCHYPVGDWQTSPHSLLHSPKHLDTWVHSAVLSPETKHIVWSNLIVAALAETVLEWFDFDWNAHVGREEESSMQTLVQDFQQLSLLYELQYSWLEGITCYPGLCQVQHYVEKVGNHPKAYQVHLFQSCSQHTNLQ